jgi:hypothetical protein
MVRMRRRQFLELSLLASAASFSRAYGFDQPSTQLRLTIDPGSTGNTIGPDFTGLSYETQQLGDPTFFSPDNAELIALVRRLGQSGILRIGGNSSEYSYWTPKPTAADFAAASAPVNPSTGKQPDAVRKVTPQAVRNLNGFIDATGWKLIYGLNMGTGTAEDAADEAAYVMNLLGPKLVAFQLCNEPDLFHHNGIRKAGYNFTDFAKEWQHFYEVIRARVPNAPFSGPDTAFNNEWLAPFAKQFKSQIQFLSQHYYAEGPPTDPSMTIQRLLRPSPQLEAEFAGMQQTCQENGLTFRLTETNSCYSAGKPGVSNTFASALWGAELMYQLATAGGIGINFHGGGYGWYTPIAGTAQKGLEARPIYYGMLLFQQAGAGQLISNTLSQPQTDNMVSAYSLKTPIGIKTILFNKRPDTKISLTVDPGHSAKRAKVLRLTGPSLDATSGVTLGNDAVDANANWTAKTYSIYPPNHGASGLFTIDLPAASAALVTFES